MCLSAFPLCPTRCKLSLTAGKKGCVVPRLARLTEIKHLTQGHDVYSHRKIVIFLGN